MDNVRMLHETLEICRRGFYLKDGKRVDLKLTREQMEKAEVFLPGDLLLLEPGLESMASHSLHKCSFDCRNMDSFSLARERQKELDDRKTGNEERVLVLNLANPVNPGGGVRGGARAQEEDLCRKSSLLLSLEGPQASAYYRYNRGIRSNMGSDALMIQPFVEILRDERGNLLEETVIVSVLTCAAPILLYGMGGMRKAEYEDLMYGRIRGMLKAAAFRGYHVLVLGAFGCGAFANDARVVSDLFHRALQELDFGGLRTDDLFDRVDFAVLDRSYDQYNFRQFARNFSSK